MKIQVLEQVPLGRLGRPEEVTNAAHLVASEDSSHVKGIELPVDGGLALV